MMSNQIFNETSRRLIMETVYLWLEKFNISYSDMTDKNITRIYLIKNKFNFTTSPDKIYNYRSGYYLTLDTNSYPEMSTMMSFTPGEYLNHYKNVSNYEFF